MSKTIVIAYGGLSPEHEVSVLSAMQAFSALEDSEYQTLPLYVSKTGRWYTGEYLLKLEHYEDLDRIVEQGNPCMLTLDDYGQPVLREEKPGFLKRPVDHSADTILLSFHGGDGENGSFQGLCETLNIPYTGCNVLSSAIGMDKVTAKALCRAHDIPVVEDYDFYESDWGKNQQEVVDSIEELGYPVIVKPAHLGSSIGVSKAVEREELIAHIELAFRYDEHILVEKAVNPLMEINCSVLGSAKDCRTSVCERPVGKEELLSFTDKYQSDSGESKGMASAARVIPADIPDELTEKIQNASKNVFTIFKGSGVVRLDFLVNADTLEFYFNEINTIPGSFSYYLWEETGVSFSTVLRELIELARDRHRRKNGRIQSYKTNLLSQKAVKGIKGLKGVKNSSQQN